MAIKETVRSLSAIFIIFGVGGLLLNGLQWAYADAVLAKLQTRMLSGLVRPADVRMHDGVVLSARIFVGAAIAGIALSVAFLYVGINVRKLLAAGVKVITRVIYVAYALCAAPHLILFLITQEVPQLGYGALEGLILWYLHRSAKRLALEATTPPAPPTYIPPMPMTYGSPVPPVHSPAVHPTFGPRVDMDLLGPRIN